MTRSRKRLSGALGLGLVASGALLVPTPAQANPAGTGLVISEVYGGGGNADAPYTNDFIELYNPTTEAISVAGMSVQYRSATGNTAQVTPLTGSVPAMGHYLVQQGAGSVVTDKPLPTPDATGSISMSGSNGVVLLVASITAFTTVGNLAGNPGVIDAVGYGTTPTSFETAKTGVALTNTTAASRSAAGSDTDHNANDYSELPPTPTASGGSGPVDPPTDPPTDPPAGELKTIAQIQGTGDRSPLEAKTVTTRGVVTADYDTGGYNGFYIQTPGTGGTTDATPGASDAVFVYGGAATTKVKVGDYIEVTGVVSEFNGTTQVSAPAAANVTVLSDAVAAPTAVAMPLPVGDVAKEAHEGELLAPSGPFTVTNTYTTNQYGEVGLATGTTPLIQPTEVADAQDTAAIAAVQADNAMRAITLDDGASTNYLTAGKDSALPWLRKDNPVRVGARVTFTGPVVLEYRNNTWKLQPTAQVTDAGGDVATFQNTRTSAPENVGGDVRLATFNVLNYFPTTADEFVAMGGGRTCSTYKDRAGNPITANECTPDGPRGAANAANLARQQIKIVTAINKLDASIVSLEEIENSVKFGKDRDYAVSELVKALNAAAGSDVWAHVASPGPSGLPELSAQDVIRTAFIYKPADVSLVGASKVLVGSAAFTNARQPLAQVFKATGADDSTAFAVIVNHFKSKGSGVDDGTGQGNANPDRIAQATALADFADSLQTERGIDKVFLTGDFNAYSMEDPIQVLETRGYELVDSTTDPAEETYSFSGLSGSLDHVLANTAASATVTGSDIWQINSAESVGYEYSRHNYNAVDLYEPNVFRSSDHDPQIVGIDVADPGPATLDVQVIGTNDFHGRIVNPVSSGVNNSSEAGAAVLTGAVKQLRAENPNTVFAAAGDLIGASTFDSFIQKDKPTIDALNEAGLEVSAAGNHEFDAGLDDLLDRVMAPYNAETNPLGGAEWEYLAANVRDKTTHDHVLPDRWIKDLGPIEVGFVGAVTEDLPSLVSPSGIATVDVTDIVTEVNASAQKLEDKGADVIVMLVHEGAASTAYSAVTDDSAFAQIVAGASPDIDAIVSGHTHLAYNHSVPVPEWVAEDRAVTERPVVSAGQYGTKLNKLVFTLDTATGEVVAKTQDVLDLEKCVSGCTGSSQVWEANYPVDAEAKKIVDEAVTKSNDLGARVLGKIGGAFNRARLADVTTENRGGESTLGNLVAEVQRWATRNPESGEAQIAFMNPGGLRKDMAGTGSGAFPRDLTYKQAAEVQPFANTLVNMDLTGADIKAALEQQWQPEGSSRPFLRLGISKGFSYTYDATRPEGDRITGMWLNGEAIVPTQKYSVTVNSFLASGGDNFRTFNNGTGKSDTGKVDLQTMVDYLDAFASGTTALPVDSTQRSVGVTFPSGAPAAYAPGDRVKFALSSLAFTAPGDVQDATVQVFAGPTSLGTFPVDNTVGTAVFDDYGTASVDVAVPAGTPAGVLRLRVRGTTTGTEAIVPVTVKAGPTEPTKLGTATTATAATMTYGTAGSVTVTVTPATATGTVTVTSGESTLGTATLSGGSATITVPGSALEPGAHSLAVSYSGDALHQASSGTAAVTVEKAKSVVTATLAAASVETGQKATVTAVVTAGSVSPTGTVEAVVDGAVVDSARLSGGQASLVVGPFDTAGPRTITVRFSGDAHVAASFDSVVVTVVAPEPIEADVAIRHTPEKVKAGKTRAMLVVRVTAGDVTPTGTVEVRVPGHGVLSATLANGKAKIQLPKFGQPGTKTLTVTYSGDDQVKGASGSYELKVVKQKKDKRN